MSEQNKQNQKYLFRPPTIPVGRNKSRHRSRQRQKQVQIPGLEVISRPRENFFKLFFQRDKYLWVVLHQNIRKPTEEMVELSQKVQKAFINLNLPDDQLPICQTLEEYKRWSKDNPCKVAVDESMGQDIFRVMDDDNAIMIKVITKQNANIVKKLRKHKHSNKVRGIHENFDEIISQIKQDTQRVRIETNKDKLQKVRLPNFMKLKLKDKADLIRYRNNLYCLATLHKTKTDLQASKKRFLQQCQVMYTSPKDQGFINYYGSYPFNDTEILRFYTEDCFFYRCLNNTLRIAKTPDQFFIIGDPFNKMFHAIQNIYRKQYPYTQSRKKLKLYRGTDLSQTQTQYIENCFGSYIQIHGFVSTTEDIEVAKKFARERNHNKIIEIIFEDIETDDSSILSNDYGFVNLVDISRYQERQILFNALNIFKVVGKQKRGEFQYYILEYGSIFNILSFENPEFLKKNDRVAYYTYKELMGEKVHMEDYGQVFLKSNQTQKSVDYYDAKIIQAKGQNKSDSTEYTIKKSEALIQNGEPAKALETMIFLIQERGSIKRTESGARFLQTVLQDKGEIIKEIDITKKYTEASQSLDQFDKVEQQLTQTDQALQDALKDQDAWDFDVSFGRLQMKMQMVYYKESIQNYQEMVGLLRDADGFVEEMIMDISKKDISFQNHKKLLMEQTLIYQLMAKISDFLEGDFLINMQQLEGKYKKTEEILINLIQQKSYDRSLIQIRKAEIKRHRQTFNEFKSDIIKSVMDSLLSIKESSINDSEVPKAYHLLSDMQKSDSSLSSMRTAIDYLQKEYTVNTQYYSEYDPKSIKTVIDIAQCHREIKNSKESLNILKEEVKVVPFRNRPQHTIVSKTLYTMGLAYLDLGEYSYAIKCFQKGINMLREILSKKQFDKYHHRYKMEMQMGRTLTFLIRYNQAEERLNSYHMFIVQLYKNQHSDIANSLNHFAILYMKWRKFEQARSKFQQSSQMFKKTSGENSLVFAKIKCNLGMVYATFNQKNKALKEIDKAKELFDDLYFEEGEIAEYRGVHKESFMIYYYYAEINKMFKEFTEAIQFYRKSIDYFKQYNAKKRRQRENQGSVSIMGYSMIQSRADIHQLSCEVKVLECRAKVKDLGFGEDLARLTTNLQREIREIKKASEEQQKQMDKSKSSQLMNLLVFCKQLKGILERFKKRQQPIKQSFVGQIQGQSAMLRQNIKTII